MCKNASPTPLAATFDELTDAQRAVALELLRLLLAAHIAALPPAVVTARLLGVKCCEVQEN